jgi:hypothetical protein
MDICATTKSLFNANLKLEGDNKRIDKDLSVFLLITNAPLFRKMSYYSDVLSNV